MMSFFSCATESFTVTIKFIFFSPLLDKIDIDLTGIDWGIIAAQNHPRRLPRTEWVTTLVDRLEKAGAKVFLQDNLRPILDDDFPQVYEIPE